MPLKPCPTTGGRIKNPTKQPNMTSWKSYPSGAIASYQRVQFHPLDPHHGYKSTSLCTPTPTNLCRSATHANPSNQPMHSMATNPPTHETHAHPFFHPIRITQTKYTAAQPIASSTHRHTQCRSHPMNLRRPTKRIPTLVNLHNLSPAPDLPNPRRPPTTQRGAPRPAAANTCPNADPTQDNRTKSSQAAPNSPIPRRPSPPQSRTTYAGAKKEPTPTTSSSHTTRTANTPTQSHTKKRPSSESTALGSTPPQRRSESPTPSLHKSHNLQKNHARPANPRRRQTDALFSAARVAQIQLMKFAPT